MRDLSNWKEVTKNMYTHPIISRAGRDGYEIVVTHLNSGADILTAYATLYVTGNWYDNKGNSSFERRVLLMGTVLDCLNRAEEIEHSLREC